MEIQRFLHSFFLKGAGLEALGTLTAGPPAAGRFSG
jgi:hypothetical protein